jgi:hypothetical protein
MEKVLAGLTVTVAVMLAVTELAGAMQVNVKLLVPAVVGLTVAVPAGDWLPLHAPLAVQVAALDVHISVTACPAMMVPGWADNEIVGGVLLLAM